MGAIDNFNDGPGIYNTDGIKIWSPTTTCPMCDGIKFLVREEIVDGMPIEYPAEVCFKCEGKGWVTI